MKYLKFFAVFITFSLFIISCESTKVQIQPAEIKKYSDAMLWELSGTDKNGNPSTVYCFGSIHLGDERLFPLPESVTKAFNSANRYSGEISNEEYKQLQKLLLKKMIESAIKVKKQSKNLMNYLTEEEINFLSEKFGEENLQIYCMYEPWVLDSALEELMIEKTNLNIDHGYDFYFMDILDKKNINYDGLDPIEVQLDIIAFGDYDFQLQKLKNNLKNLMTENDPATAELIELFNIYYTYDDTVIGDFLDCSIESELETEPYMEAYENAMTVERNKKWSVKIADYLYEGGVTFIFAGCAHFAGKNSVFSFMKQNGTLVTDK